MFKNSKFSKFLAGAAVAAAMIFSLGATQASALTAADIDVLVSLGLVDASKAQAVKVSLGLVSTTISNKVSFTRDLTVGSRGEDVTALQALLGINPTTGYFGPITRGELMKYQALNGITPSVGYFGSKTRAFVNSLVTQSIPSTGTTTATSTTVVSGNGVSVSLSPSTPSANAIIAGQAAANMVDYVFTNNTSSNVIVTNVSLARGGVSSDSMLSNVYLFNGATRLTDSATVSSGKISFNAGTGVFTIPANGSVTISVKSDIDANASAGTTINLSLLGVTSNSSVSANYPIKGSTFTIARPTDLATVSMSSTVVPTSVEAGTINQTIWGANLTQSVRAVYLKSLAVKVIGSVPSSSFQNISLYLSGVKISSATGVDSNGMITFDLTSNPYKIESSRNLEIRADIVNGSTRSFAVSLQNLADAQFVDSNYNIGISVSGTLPTTDTITINGGSLAVSLDSSFSSGDVVLGSSNTILAKYTAKAYGENMKVSYLKVSSNVALSGVTIYSNGVSISSSQNVSSTTDTTFSLGSSLIVGAGETASLEIRGNLQDPSGINLVKGTQVSVTLKGYTNNTQGSFSWSLKTYPSTNIQGPTLSVVGAGLGVAKNSSYNDTTLTENTNSVKIGSFVLSSNSSEAVRITGLKVTLNGTLPLTSLSNLYTSENSVKVNPQISNNFGTNFSVAANNSKIIDIFADVGQIATTSGSTIISSLEVTATGATSNIDASASAVSGQTLTVGTGSLSTPTLTNSSQASQLVVGPSTGSTIGSFNFKSTVGTSVISELGFNVSGNQSAITAIQVGDVVRQVAGIGATTTVSGLNLVIPVSNAGIDVPVKVTYNSVGGNGGIVSGSSTALVLTSVKYQSGNTTKTIQTSVVTNSAVVVAGYPTVSILKGSVNSLVNGTVKLAEVTISAVGNSIKVTNLGVRLSLGGSASTTGAVLLQDGNTVVASTTVDAVSGANDVIFNNGGYTLSAGQSKTFGLYGGLTGVDSGDSITTQLGNSTTFKWNDVEGNGVGLDASLITSYSTTDSYSVVTSN